MLGKPFTVEGLLVVEAQQILMLGAYAGDAEHLQSVAIARTQRWLQRGRGTIERHSSCLADWRFKGPVERFGSAPDCGTSRYSAAMLANSVALNGKA